jgi:hypothetical protein|tara:strand:- start:72 stop:713 length:642 start_codon:yes stop_codon:yes gene_type:complete
MAATYAALVTEVRDFLNRADLTEAQIGTFIALAESNMNSKLRVREMVERATATLNAEYEYVPSNFLEARRIYISNTTPTHELRAMSPQALIRAHPSASTGRPRAYSVVSSQMQFKPAPDSASTYVIEMSFYATLPGLTDANQTNSVLSRYPNLYLFSVCCEASTYLLDDQGLQRYAGMRDRLIDEANTATEMHQYAAGPLVAESHHGVEGRFR